MTTQQQTNAKPNEHPLVKLGRERFAGPKEAVIRFVEDEAANAQLNDLDHFPHMFVLACCMDRQIMAELAWMIPHRVGQKLGGFDIERLAAPSLDEYKALFAAEKCTATTISWPRYSTGSCAASWSSTAAMRPGYGRTGRAAPPW